MKELMDEVWKPLRLDHPREPTGSLQFLRVSPPTQIFLRFPNEGCAPHFRDHGRDPANQIGRTMTLDGGSPTMIGYFSHRFGRKLR